MRRYLYILLFLLITKSLCADDASKYITVEDNCENSEKEKTVVYEEGRISKHKEIYALAGSPNTKVQISLKYQLIGNVNLFVAYTQQMFWELGKESNPFKDVNFNPEVFYRHIVSKDGFLRSVDFGIYEHKSNGKAGADSRAWSRSYIKLNTVTKFGKWSFNWDTKLFFLYRFALDETNIDIYDYMGFWETRFAFFNYFDPNEFIDRAEIYFAFNSGGKFSQQLNKGAQELGLRFRIGWGRFNPSVFFQVYHGYNESLLSYNVSYWAYRLGLAF